MFKVGDMVKCVDGWMDINPCLGKVYTVKGVRGRFLDFEFGAGWLDTRFEMVASPFKGNIK